VPAGRFRAPHRHPQEGRPSSALTHGLDEHGKSDRWINGNKAGLALRFHAIGNPSTVFGKFLHDRFVKRDILLGRTGRAGIDAKFSA
jgi:hypothetical protein